jgi:hypothetical protein
MKGSKYNQAQQLPIADINLNADLATYAAGSSPNYISAVEVDTGTMVTTSCSN